MRESDYTCVWCGARGREIVSVSRFPDSYGRMKRSVSRSYPLLDNEDPGYLSIDHIKPFSKGGDHSPDNLRVLCMRCNTSRGAP